jgi:hypothetical protein
MAGKFPFNIRQVAGILDLTVRYGREGNGNMDVDCPFCNHKRGKMNLNVYKNAYRCNICDESGGMLSLYGKIHNISNSDAYWEICELLGYDGKNPASYNNAPQKAASEIHSQRADDNTVHQTYSMMLSLLKLESAHRENLLSRGLSPDFIVKYGYKSVPAFGQQGLCEKLMQSGCVIEGVPGFYKEVDKGGAWNVKLKAPGILIPVCGIDGKISAMQVRLNKPVNDRKYLWLSSNDMDGGASSGAPIHFVGDPTAKRVYITEGPLKGTVAHNLTRYTFICLPGVKNIGRLDSLLECLKANGTQEAIEAFDMDKFTNEHVGNAAVKLRDKLSTHGFKVSSAIWEDKRFNGIDNYYLHRLNEKRRMACGADIAAAA